MDNLVQGQVWAAGKMTGAGVLVFQRGCVLARTGAGVYTITLDKEIDAAECTILATPNVAGDAAIGVVDTSDAVKTLNAFNTAGAATDTDFSFVILRNAL